MTEMFLVKIIKNPRLNRNSVQISKEAADGIGLQEGPISLLAGKLESSVNVMISTKKHGQLIEINPKILNSLHVPDGRSYNIRVTNDGIRIGPVIGIMIDNSNDKSRPCGGQSLFISQLNTEANALGEVCYAFYPENINFQTKTILGYSFVNKHWKKKVYPMPDVVYPREGGYSFSNLQIRNKLEIIGCKFINPPLIGKWNAYQILSNNHELAQYIPDTQLIVNQQQIEQMLLSYEAVYLKPINGSQGRNIIKVSKNKSGNSYLYQYQINHKYYKDKANNISDLYKKLKKLMGGRHYIVQQQIDLLRVDGNIADVRVLVQKDNNGQWSITGRAYRIGKKDSITSNISGGGTAKKIEVILAEYFPDPVTREIISRKTNELALEAASVLEFNTASIGELGIDIGIDKNGQIWFIEANLKPARKVFIIIGEKSTRLMSVKSPLLYARYLAGFTMESGL